MIFPECITGIECVAWKLMCVFYIGENEQTTLSLLFQKKKKKPLLELEDMVVKHAPLTSHWE